MGTPPVMRTWAPGDALDSATLNSQLRDAVNFALTTPRCCAVKSIGSSQNITTATYTVLGLDAEQYDTDGMHAPSVNNSRVYAQTPGWYQITARCSFQTSATGNRRGVAVRLNAAGSWSGGTFLSDMYASPMTGIWTGVTATFSYQLSAGDYVEMFGYQDSGGTIGVQTSLAGYNALTVTWSAPL